MGRPRTKILCVCEGGSNRSVGLTNLLKDNPVQNNYGNPKHPELIQKAVNWMRTEGFL